MLLSFVRKKISSRNVTSSRCAILSDVIVFYNCETTATKNYFETPVTNTVIRKIIIILPLLCYYLLLNILVLLTQKIAIAILISGILSNILSKLYSCHKRAETDAQGIFRNETFIRNYVYIYSKINILNVSYIKKSIISIINLNFDLNLKLNLNFKL